MFGVGVLIITGLILGGISLFLRQYAEPAIYMVFPPSPTVTLTPTITLTQTISVTPSITPTFTITPTPAISYTPQIPQEIAKEFTALITPNSAAVFSFPVFSREIDEDMQPVDPLLEFENPITHLYATFSYDQMIVESQWSAVWYRLADDEIICFETKPWDGSTGGYGYTECDADIKEWLAGEYEVRIFIGEIWKSSERFTVIGDPPSPTTTSTPTRTATPTWTLTPTRTTTLIPSETSTRTRTVVPSSTLTVTPSLTKTMTLTRTLTPTRTSTTTRTPTRTPTNTLTPTPSKTLTPTETKVPTLEYE